MVGGERVGKVTEPDTAVLPLQPTSESRWESKDNHATSHSQAGPGGPTQLVQGQSTCVCARPCFPIPVSIKCPLLEGFFSSFDPCGGIYFSSKYFVTLI